jgi:thioredoxin-dependent peroxiredoxin
MAVNRSMRTAQLVAALAVMTSSALAAQEAQPAPGSAAFAPTVGQMAPDFTLPGATRFGLLKAPVKLSDYRGQSVVIAFFPRARTRG